VCFEPLSNGRRPISVLSNYSDGSTNSTDGSNGSNVSNVSKVASSSSSRSIVFLCPSSWWCLFWAGFLSFFFGFFSF